MGESLGRVKSAVYAFADAASFLFGTVPGLILVAAAIALAAALRVASALSQRRLLARAAGETLARRAAAGVALRELGRMALRALSALPAVAVLAAATVALVGAAESSRALDDYLEGRRRVAELSATLRNLERRYRAVEVEILEASGGSLTAELSFYDYRKPSAPSRRQTIRLPGRELYIDAIVCNFEYSEIAAGRAVNLAIPYRAFTDRVAQSEGVELGLLDEEGVPLMYRRRGEDVYGIEAAAYDARLVELAAILRSEEAARGAGIVRSLYGNAVHRAVDRGDSFTIWVEQSGGLSIKDARAF